LKTKITHSTEEFENALKQSGQQKFVLRLYVKGQTPNSRRAMENADKICREHLEGRYTLEIIDLDSYPERAREEDIIAIPALIKEIPGPLRKLIGDLSNTERVLIGLGLITLTDG
jgi:circadian clock protein KaiB